MEKATQPQVLGRYIVADPGICHGKLTFRGTRILVADVLDQVAAGLAWGTIIAEWRGGITQEAIAEAVRLARQALLEHVSEMTILDLPDGVYLDEDEIHSYGPETRPNGKCVVTVTLVHENGDHYCVECVWKDDAQKWVCDEMRHLYYEGGLHQGRSEDVVASNCKLPIIIASVIRRTFKVAPSIIKAEEVIRTPPMRLQALSIGA